jgi:hypothetical protein
MSWFNSIENLSKIIPIAQILIVALTVFTIWATAHRGNLEKQEKSKLAQKITQTMSLTENLTKQNIELEAELTENKAKLNDLKKKTEPRSLFPEQKRKLAQLLPPPASFRIAVACRLMDMESCNYGEELIGVFRDLKWQIGETNRTFLDDIQGDVVVAVTDDTQISMADRILKALNNVGIKASNQALRKNSISGVKTNTLCLIVGAKKQIPEQRVPMDN